MQANDGGGAKARAPATDGVKKPPAVVRSIEKKTFHVVDAHAMGPSNLERLLARKSVFVLNSYFQDFSKFEYTRHAHDSGKEVQIRIQQRWVYTLASTYDEEVGALNL
jgi:hypothetical protein